MTDEPIDSSGDAPREDGEDPPHEEQKQKLEALLFTSPEPLRLRDLKEVVDLHGNKIKSLLDDLDNEYGKNGRAFTIKHVADGYQLMTRPEHRDMLESFHGRERDRSLSQAAMETLSIVAYEQPITRAELESIRGVQSGQLLRNLMDKGFLRIRGRKDAPGRPILYGTTNTFLEAFGLSSLDDLPEPDELMDRDQ